MATERENVGGSTLSELASAVRLGKFLSVGAVGAVFDTAILVALVELLAMEPTLAKLFSAESAILLMFVLNERWTFRGQGAPGLRSVGRRLLTSNVVRAGGAGTALVVLWVLNGRFGVWYLLANVVGIGVGVFVNYVLESLLTWRVWR